MSPLATAATITLFVAVGGVFLLVNLLVGMLLRPSRPSTEKGEIYECGEATIGSSHIQFDLRFYIIALLFLVLDVEVAFFFPWANVFGTATQLADPNLSAVQQTAEGTAQLNPSVERLYATLGSQAPTEVPTPELQATMHETGSWLATFAVVDAVIFFAVVLVGFAYLWYRGDINWVRAVGSKPQEAQRPISYRISDDSQSTANDERYRDAPTPAIPVSGR